MAHIIVEQSAREMALILDDMERIREGIAGLNPQEWADRGNSPRVLWECLRDLRHRLQYGYTLLGDWESIIAASEGGVPDVPPESF